MLVDEPLTERRGGWKRSPASIFRRAAASGCRPRPPKLADAKKWLTRVGATLDGIIAKRRDLPYRAGDRNGMQKIKNYRSADCVVGGFRYNEGKPVVGSLLLGLYDEDGKLNHVGFTSVDPARGQTALTKKLEKLIAPPGFTGNAPGGPSRWSTARSAEWQPLKPLLICATFRNYYAIPMAWALKSQRSLSHVAPSVLLLYQRVLLSDGASPRHTPDMDREIKQGRRSDAGERREREARELAERTWLKRATVKNIMAFLNARQCYVIREWHGLARLSGCFLSAARVARRHCRR